MRGRGERDRERKKDREKRGETKRETKKERYKGQSQKRLSMQPGKCAREMDPRGAFK